MRIAVDVFRDYPTFRLALGTGQTLNIAMMLIGLVLLYRSRLRRQGRLGVRRIHIPRDRSARDDAPTMMQRAAVAALLLFCLTIPSNWTQDVPVRYGPRHPGMTRTWLYPPIDTSRYRRETITRESRPRSPSAALPMSPDKFRSRARL